MTGQKVVCYCDRHAVAHGLADLWAEQIGCTVADVHCRG